MAIARLPGHGGNILWFLWRCKIWNSLVANLVITQIAFATPEAKPDTAADFFPLDVGNYWWFVGDNGSHGGTTRSYHHRVHVVSKWDSLGRTYSRLQHTRQEIISHSVPVASEVKGPETVFTSLLYETGNEIFANRVSLPHYFHFFGIRADADSLIFLEIGIHRFNPSDSLFTMRRLPTRDSSFEDVPYYVRLSDNEALILVEPRPGPTVAIYGGGGGWLHPGIGYGMAPFDQVQIHLLAYKTQFSQSTPISRRDPEAKGRLGLGRESGIESFYDLKGRRSSQSSGLLQRK